MPILLSVSQQILSPSSSHSIPLVNSTNQIDEHDSSTSASNRIIERKASPTRSYNSYIAEMQK